MTRINANREKGLSKTADLIYPEESYAIVGACFDVHNEMGCGFLESVYQECLEIELARQQIPFESQKELSLTYAGRPLRQKYIADFVCFEKIIVEVKAAKGLLPEHEAQLLNYLNATGLKLGILVNFGHHPKLQSRRIALTRSGRRSYS